MYLFDSDYLEGAHPAVLAALAETNFEQQPGYGEDRFCKEAAALIRSLCKDESLDVHFLPGGTPANLTVITAALRPHQAAVACGTGHISGHETGAIEAAGHKVLTAPDKSGKLSAAQVRSLCEEHYADPSFEHTPQPGLVYISQPTECGTVYSAAELTALREVCDAYGLLLYIDGARLGCALVCEGAGADLPTLAALSDAFTIGGTKLGALYGEALVLKNPALKRDFRYILKQRGGMLSKGRLMGAQFLALLKDGLYFDIARSEVAKALRVRDAFTRRGCAMWADSPTNQQFPILTEGAAAKLSENYGFSVWKRLEGGKLALRFCTSWATTDEAVDALVRAVEEMKGI